MKNLSENEQDKIIDFRSPSPISMLFSLMGEHVSSSKNQAKETFISGREIIVHLK